MRESCDILKRDYPTAVFKAILFLKDCEIISFFISAAARPSFRDSKCAARLLWNYGTAGALAAAHRSVSVLCFAWEISMKK